MMIFAAIKRLGARLRAVFRRGDLDRDFEAELESHLAMLAEDNLRQGMTPDEARREASMRLGGRTALAEQHRGARGLPALDCARRDLRSAFRSIAKTPRFSVSVAGVLALGLGLSAAVFTIVNGVFLKPLPYPTADRLVWMWGTSPRITTASVTPADYLSYREVARSFEHLAASFAMNVDIMGDREPQRIPGAMVSWNFFDALGMPPEMGRSFRPEDEHQAVPEVAILSYGVWQSLFGGDPEIIGRQILMERQTVTVAGVMPARFRPPMPADVWLPLPLPEMTSRSAHFLRPIGLLRRGVPLSEAQSELHAVATALQAEFPETNTGWTATLVPLQDIIVGRAGEGLRMLWMIVGCVLLLACSNAAGLLMARVMARQQEFAVKLALGASGTDVIRQVLIETVILAMLGGLLGVAIAHWGVQLLLAINPGSVPLPGQIGIDTSVIVFVLALAAVTGLVSGLPSAIHARRPDQRGALQHTRATASPAGRRALRTFVVAEFALALVLVTGASLAIGNFLNLWSVDTGFRTEGLVTGEVSLSRLAFPSAEQRIAFWERLLEHINNTPGVQQAAYVSEVSFGSQMNDVYFHPEGRPPSGPDDMVTADYLRVSANYFATMGIPLRRGRYFTAQESRMSTKVIAISETFAARSFAGQDPLGTQLMVGAPNAEAYEIVAVVGDVRHRAMGSTPRPTMYVPSLDVSPMNIVLRTAGDEEAMAGALREIVASVDRNQPVARPAAMKQLIGRSLAPVRFSTYLLGNFGVIALILAGAGLFGVMAFSVATQTKDIGIRMALGARPRVVSGMVLREGLKLAAGGLVLGIPCVLLGSRIIGALPPVTTADAPMMVATAAVLLATASLACYLPARRATRIDPMSVLRRD